MKTWGTHWEQVDMVRAREKKPFLIHPNTSIMAKITCNVCMYGNL
jgi:hypothetical protein